MGYYDVYDSNDNLVASNVWIDESDGTASLDSFTLSATILYFLGFIGMGIMMVNIPFHFIFIGIIALLIYALPLFAVILAAFLKPFVGARESRIHGENGDIFVEEGDTSALSEEDEPFTYHLCNMLTEGGSVVKNVFKRFFAPFAYCLFNVFVALFWICYPLGAINEEMLLAIIVPCAYSMYYYPFVLISNAIKRKSKGLGLAAAAIIVGSLAVFLTTYDAFMEENSFVGLALFFTMLTVLGTFAILIGNVLISKKRGKRAALLLVYTLLVALVAFMSLAVLPKQNEERYNEALQCVEDGEYRRARELFLGLGRYEDSMERYNEIKFLKLEVGEKIEMGAQTDEPDSPNGHNPLSWTVIAVDGDKALVLSDAILTSIDSNPLSYWNKGNSVRGKLEDLEGLFTDEEKARIMQHTYDINLGASSLFATDKLFLLSEEELLQYCKEGEIFSREDTKYNDHQVLGYQMADFEYEYKYSYSVRGVGDSGEWIIADCEAEQFVTKDNRYVGIRPAMFITIDGQ